MKHYFLLNPAAGKGKSCGRLEADIKALFGERGLGVVIYYTAGVGDAERYVGQICDKEVGECRFYACGGDGTLGEVINGAVGFSHASVGVIPIGTGNDFVRNFTHSDNFLSLEAQLEGSTVALDLIKYNGRYSAVTLNAGFDAEVVKIVARIKRNPAVPGKLAYVLGALWQLIRKPGVKIKVSIDGAPAEERNLLLTCIGNSAYCGGGFNSGPCASPADGLIDVCFIKNVSRLKFLSLLGSYKNGKYLSRKGIDKIVEYIKCEKLDISFPEPRVVSVDGELRELDMLTLELAPGALRFCLPAGCEVITPSDIPACAKVKTRASGATVG